MHRRTREFGQLKLILLFLFISVFIPAILSLFNSGAGAAGTLGSFDAGETGIKLCASINDGQENNLRFLVTNNQGFSADILVENNTCRKIHTEAATYTIRHFIPQEYELASVSGGTVSADNTPFIATSTGQYAIIYTDNYTKKGYLHSFGYTNTNTASSAVEVAFDANGGTGAKTDPYIVE